LVVVKIVSFDDDFPVLVSHSPLVSPSCVLR
jgi:hypothetical protein